MLYAMIVVYNKFIGSSPSFIALHKHSFINVVVFDNSEGEYENRRFCEEQGCIYYTMHKNLGLSKAYNYVCRKLLENNSVENDYIMIFDDDTIVNEDYLEEVKNIVSSGKYDVLLPVVKAEDKIISPCALFRGKVPRSVKSIDVLYRERNLSAINSGMVVRIKLYRYLKYNENMFLDFIDHEFMWKARNMEVKIYVLKSCLLQNFSRDQKSPNIEGVLKRFNTLKQDLLIYCQECQCMWYYPLHIWKFAFKLTVRYKTTAFINAARGKA